MRILSAKTALALALIVLLGAGFFYFQLFVPTSVNQEAVNIEIVTGASLADIAQTLHEKNLIRSRLIFRTYARIKNFDTNIKAGRFPISSEMSPAEILVFLASPDHGEVRVIIPEGFSTYDIDKRLTELGLIAEGDFLKALQDIQFHKYEFREKGGNATEGYLFPDTYFVNAAAFDPLYFANVMLETFQKKAFREVQDEVLRSGRTLEEIIIMASLIEEEVQTVTDMRLVSGILWKRLENEWPLQVDATLLYGSGSRIISDADLAGDSPYNTRNRRGLPPTPISNPGLNAIMAALNPEESPYWFYLTDSEGATRFARTNEEHNENKGKYLDN